MIGAGLAEGGTGEDRSDPVQRIRNNDENETFLHFEIHHFP